MPKFIELLTSSELWMTNAEVLAKDDPYDGLPGAIQFPHRMWRTIDDVPEQLRIQILEICGRDADSTPQAAFRSWFMGEEQRCIMQQGSRREFYVNCWHRAEHESVAMWRIYGSLGTGVAIVSNGARLETALAANEEEIYLGAVQYHDPSWVRIGASNAFDVMMVKRSSFEHEREVRLVHWSTEECHDALANFVWNDDTLRFDNLVEDKRPIRPGMSFACDVDAMIERVIVSPFAPPWYGPMIGRLRERLGFSFPVQRSKLLEVPPVIP